jgi:ERCC4-related helicase
MEILNIKPRDYQESIFNTAKNSNTLVVLPTGVGKTLIALMLAVERLKKFPGEKILFLAPTKPLVDQHFDTFKENLPELFAQLDVFTGAIIAKKRKDIWQRCEIVFSTPQCVANDVKKGLYDLKEVCLLVIDEAHRCLKNYDYTKVVAHYRDIGVNQRILGLTASPGSEIGRVREICKHLDISEVESRTRESEDVKPYLQKLEFQKVEVPFPKEFEEIRVLLKIIYDEKVKELRKRNILFGPATKVGLLQLQKKLFGKLQGRDFRAMQGVSLTAQAIKISHALELLETQTLRGLENYLREIVKQANEKKSRAVQYLAKSREFNAALISLQMLKAKGVEHPKVEELKALMEEQFDEEKGGKVIVFAQFRETVKLLAEKMGEIKGVNAAVFLGQAKGAGNVGGMNQKEQKRIIDEFREGKINLLCATSIGEEGLDIPEVSAVIFYEPIPSAIRKIQRAGRTARLNPGKLMILMTKDTRDIAYHYASMAREKKMHGAIEQVKDEIKKKGKTLEDFS